MLYRLLRPLIKIFVFIVFRPKIVGKEYINDNNSLILAGNHTNNFDCILLMASTKRTIHFLAKDSLYKGMKGYLFKNMKIIPVNRNIHDKKALINGEEVLINGGVIGVFPEGTINKTSNTILPFKIGAVKMAKDTNSEIIPFTIKGDYNLFKNDLVLKFYEPYNVKSDLNYENEKLMNKIKSELER